MNLPPTSTLAGAGAGVGAGLGGLAGQVFGAPQRALMNLVGSPLIGQYAGAQAQDPYANDNEGSWTSVLPGLTGLVAGGMAAASPLAPFAGLIGAGVGGIAQLAGEVMKPEDYHAPSSSDIVRALGGDPTEGGGMAAAMGIGMLTDPLMYAGGLGGMKAGQAVGGARDALTARSAQEAALAGSVGELGDLQGLAGQAAQRYANPPMPWLDELQADAARVGANNYRPEVMQALEQMNPGQIAGDLKSYQQVNPQLAADLNDLGLGIPDGQGGMQLQGSQAPLFAQSRGGWLMPTPARAGGAAEGAVAMPGALGPQMRPGQGYLNALEDPTSDLMAMRQQAGLPPLTPPTPPEPTLMSLLSPENQERFLGSPDATISGVPTPGRMPGDATRYLDANVASLPVSEAQDRLARMMQGSQASLDAVRQQPYSRIQQLLLRSGLAG